MNLEIEKGCCYALLRVEEYHKIAEQRHDVHWYPETSMSLISQMNINPPEDIAVVTESAWIISSYLTENVRVWDENEGWVEPSQTTYGASPSVILNTVFNLKQDIPTKPLYYIQGLLGKSGMSQSLEVLGELNPIYKKSQSL